MGFQNTNEFENLTKQNLSSSMLKFFVELRISQIQTGVEIRLHKVTLGLNMRAWL